MERDGRGVLVPRLRGESGRGLAHDRLTVLVRAQESTSPPGAMQKLSVAAFVASILQPTIIMPVASVTLGA